MNKINIADSYLLRTSQAAWYDHSFHLYSFTGDFNYGRMHAALRKRFSNQFNSIGAVELVGPGWIEVEHIYHIGD